MSPEFGYKSLDVWDNTLYYLGDDTGTEPRRVEDDEEVGVRVQERAEEFGQMENLLVIADLPGGEPDQHTQRLVEGADAMIIISQDQSGLETWREFADEVDLEIIAQFETFLSDEEVRPDWDPSTGEGRLSGLETEEIEANHLNGFEESTLLRIEEIALMLIEEALP